MLLNLTEYPLCCICKNNVLRRGQNERPNCFTTLQTYICRFFFPFKGDYRIKSLAQKSLKSMSATDTQVRVKRSEVKHWGGEGGHMDGVCLWGHHRSK